MFLYELANHEYCITYELEDTLEAVGLTIQEVENSKALKHGLVLAKREYLKMYVKENSEEDEEEEM